MTAVPPLAVNQNAPNPPEQASEQPLEPVFRCDGFTHQLIERVGDVTLWRKIHPDMPRRTDFEVMIVQRQKAGLVFGRPRMAKELPPTSRQWGDLGWSYANETDARRKFGELVANALNPS